jgi:hypothetical protein
MVSLPINSSVASDWCQVSNIIVYTCSNLLSDLVVCHLRNKDGEKIEDEALFIQEIIKGRNSPAAMQILLLAPNLRPMGARKAAPTTARAKTRIRV